LEFIRTFKVEGDGKISIPIVMITAYADRAGEPITGRQGIIRKPFPVDELLRAVKKLCTISSYFNTNYRHPYTVSVADFTSI